MEIIYQVKKNFKAVFAFSLWLWDIYLHSNFLETLAFFGCVYQKTHNLKGRHFLDTVRNSASGMTYSIMNVESESNEMTMAIETETWWIIAGIENFVLY